MAGSYISFDVNFRLRMIFLKNGGGTGLTRKPNTGQTGAPRFRQFVAHKREEMPGRKAPTGARYDSLGWSKVAAIAADLAEP